MTVYVIGCEGTQRVKIGMAQDVQARMQQIECTSPFPLRLLWQSGPEHGRRAERLLHKQFDEYRVHGEWFDFGDADPVEIVRVAVSCIGPPRSAFEVAARRQRPRLPYGIKRSELVVRWRSGCGRFGIAEARGRSWAVTRVDERWMLATQAEMSDGGSPEWYPADPPTSIDALGFLEALGASNAA